MSHQKPPLSAEDDADQVRLIQHWQDECRRAPLTFADQEREYINAEHNDAFRREQE